MERHPLLWMSIAEKIAEMSYCRRKQVGAIVVKNGRIISNGFNGTPPGFPNICEDERTGETLGYVVHAEDNAIQKALPHELVGSSMFVTLSPCLSCSKKIVNSGIKAVYYRTRHSCEEGLSTLKENNIIVEQI